MKMTRVTVAGGEALSLPAEIMERLGLQEGDEVEVDVRAGEMVVVRRRWSPPDPEEYRARLESVSGSATAGLSTDEIMRMTRGEDWDEDAPAAGADPDAYLRRLQSLSGRVTTGLSTEEIMRMTRGDDWNEP